MLWITSWVTAPVIRDTVYKGDTCPGTAVHSATLGVPSTYACADVMFVFDLTGSTDGFLEILNTRHKVRRCITFGLSYIRGHPTPDS